MVSLVSSSKQLRQLQSLVEHRLSCFDVELDLAAEESLGLDVSHGRDVRVKQVREGPVLRWNQAVLQASARRTKTLQPGDTVLAVNGSGSDVQEMLATMRSSGRPAGSMVLRVRSQAGSGINLEDFSWTDYSMIKGDAHLREAFRCLVLYQQQRHGGGSRNIDPRTRFVELLKLWLRKSEAAAPALGRVELFAKLCGDVSQLKKLFPQRNSLSFIKVVAQVRDELEKYLIVHGRSLETSPKSSCLEAAHESGSEDTTASEGEAELGSDADSKVLKQDRGTSDGHFVPVLLPDEELMEGCRSRSSSCASLDIVVLPQLVIDTE